MDLKIKNLDLPFFQDFSPEDLLHVASIVSDRTIKRGHMVFCEGEDAGGFYLVVNGRIKIFKLSTDGKEQILHIIGPGEPFGEVPAFDGTPYPANAKSIEKSNILYFPRESFIDLIRKNPALALKLLTILSKRLKTFASLIEDLSLKEVPARLANYLLYVHGKQSTRDDEIRLDITKNQLASILGTIPETLSRILTKMKREKIIALGNKGLIRILDYGALEQLANGDIRLSKRDP